MSNYLDILISLKDLITYSKDLIIKYGITIYIEKWNEVKLFYYKEIDLNNVDLKTITDTEYNGLFLSSKKINLQKKISFYNDSFTDSLIEVKGGRENNLSLELIKMRTLSKSSDKIIKTFFTALQRKIQQDKRFGKGVKWGKHMYSKIYFDLQIPKKTYWGDFSKKDYEIIINSNN
ncbi:MAG: hypothetical protein ABI325_08530 [Ginsengibacter sp.]